MKQHITVKQLNELSNIQGKKKLRKWWKPKAGDKILMYEDQVKVLLEGYLPMEKEKHNLLPLLSIGQMIEFLDEKDDYFRSWYTKGISTKEYKDRNFSWKYKEEICDKLWEAVKEMLNER